MKFVIKSLLFVQLLLQVTGSLRACFDQDQNIMLTIIMLAFAVIGLIGLVVGNRFILIVFSASMMLVLIASITIYAIGRADGRPDSMRPKVPYYLSIPSEPAAGTGGSQLAPDGRPAGPATLAGDQNNESRLKSLVGKWLHKEATAAASSNGSGLGSLGRGWPPSAATATTRKRPPGSTNYLGEPKGARQRASQSGGGGGDGAAQARQRPVAKSRPASAVPLTISPLLLDDYSDEPQPQLQQPALVVPVEIPLLVQATGPLRPAAGGQQRSLPLPASGGGGGGSGQQTTKAGPNHQRQESPDVHEDSNQVDNQQQQQPPLDGGHDFGQVENEQWVAYERYLYERYLGVVSQSIDLVFLSILAAWMALLLDEDSDQCFGQSSSSSSSAASGSGRSRRRRRSTSAGAGAAAKEAPIYNYNGVRYSIRPDVGVGDSPPPTPHVVVR